MRFNGALVSSSLFVSAVIANYDPGEQLPPFLDRVENSINSTTVLSVVDSAGITWTAESEEIVQTAAGTFTVPIIEGDIHSFIAIMVGISTSECDTYTVGVGILAQVTEFGVFYPAFAQWGSDRVVSSPRFSAGDRIRVSIELQPTSARVKIKVFDSDMEDWKETVFGTPRDSRCKQEVKWMVTTRLYSPLPDFDPVTIRDMEVEVSGVKVVPRRPDIKVDNIEYPQVQTSVMFYRDYAIVVYIPPPPPG